MPQIDTKITKRKKLLRKLTVFLGLFILLRFCFSTEVYFSDFPYQTNLEAIVVDLINMSQNNISIAAYNFDSPSIVSALLNAANRGVRIRIIVDSDYWNTLLDYLDGNPNIEVINDRKTKGYIKNSRQHHNKFMIFDYGFPSGVWDTILTGSFNFSQESQYKAYNNIVVERSNYNLASIYIQEFNESWGGNSFTFDVIQSKMGREKRDPPPNIHTTGNFEVYFSYSDTNKIKDKIIQLIRNSSNIFMTMFSFSKDSEIYDEIFRSLEEEKNVYIVLDGAQAKVGYSAYATLKNLFPDNVFAESEYKKLHHKYIIFNYTPNNPENAIIVTGSYNISRNSEENNDENIIVIKSNSYIAKKYFENFIYHLRKANGTFPLFNLVSVNSTLIKGFQNQIFNIYGQNLSEVVSVIASNENNYLGLEILEVENDFITIRLPNVSGIFDLLLKNNQNEIITVSKLIVYSYSNYVMLVNQGRKDIYFDEAVNVKIFGFTNSQVPFLKVILGEKIFFKELSRVSDILESEFYMDTFLPPETVSNSTPVVFNFENIYITNTFHIPQFLYTIEKPKFVHFKSYNTIKFIPVQNFKRTFKISADSNVPINIKENVIEFFANTKEDVVIFITIIDDLGFHAEEYIKIPVVESGEITIYPTFLKSGLPVYIEGEYKTLNILDKNYTKVRFEEKSDPIGRKYIIPLPKVVPTVLFFIFETISGEKVIKKVIVN